MPPELRGLTQLEEMMIAQAHPVITVYAVRGGQRKTKNHVVNFPQNVTRFFNTLPLHPDNVPLIVRRRGVDGAGHYDFRVRRGVVRQALLWLQANNKWYRNIQIDWAGLGELPDDGNLEARFTHNAPLNAPQPRANADEPEDEELGEMRNNFFNYSNLRTCRKSSGGYTDGHCSAGSTIYDRRRSD